MRKIPVVQKQNWHEQKECENEKLQIKDAIDTRETGTTENLITGTTPSVAYEAKYRLQLRSNFQPSIVNRFVWHK